MKGYKVFNSDWTCRGFQYKVGETYETGEQIKLCDRGFHFCEKANDCFNYYSFDSSNKVAEIEALGEIINDGGKSVTNKIKIVREISWHEVLELVNTGKNNTGRRNTGSRNAGDWNTGNRNAGDRNAGDWNAGDWNTGNRNAGDWNIGSENTGDWNAGNWNTGNRNIGNWNTGDWNTADNSSGVFCTAEEKIRIFDQPSDMTLQQWRNSDAYYIMHSAPLKKYSDFVLESDMTEAEKQANPEYKTIGGFTKVIENTPEDMQNWWDKLPKKDKQIIKDIPNFDADKFLAVTGIVVK